MRGGGVAAGEGTEAAGRGSRLRPVLVAALVAGIAARVVLALGRPLWADEIFTLTLARGPLEGILAALRLDSGPPLHYLLSHLLLAPSGATGESDLLVRLLSVAASLLHVPLLLRVGRLEGTRRAGEVAAALFLVFPLAAASGAEGRGYALASLLVLAAFERLLALEQDPRATTAALAGLLGGAAVLTHYLALLPVAGALVSATVRARRRRPVLLAALVAAAIASSWLPVALFQPRASMAWAQARPLGERLLESGANLGLGLPAGPDVAWLLGPLSLLLLGAALATRRGRARVPAAAPLVVGLGLLVPLVLFSRSALLPDRTALLFLPFVALVFAEARAPLPAAAGAAAALVLAASLPGWLRPTPASLLAERLVPEVRAGARVVADGLWGPELSYRLGRAGLPGRVTLHPSDVRLHPGWLEEGEIPAARLASETREVVAAAAPRTLFVLTAGTRSGAALAAELGARGGRRVADAVAFEVWTVPAPAGAGGASR